MSNQQSFAGADVTVPLRAVVDRPGLALEAVRETLRPGALDLPVRWAHVSELRDPAPYLLGDELLLTAGVNLPGEQREVDRYVRGLRAAGITALGFGVTPPIHEELPRALRRSCARHGLPLLVVPVETPFLAISRAVSVALGEASRRDERRIAEAREALTRAASSGLGEVVRGLAQRLSGWVAMVGGADGVPVAEVRAPLPFPTELSALLGRLWSGTGIRSATTELADGTFVVAQPAGPAHLLVAGRRTRFENAERMIAGVGAGVLGLVARSGVATLGSALTSLLLGETRPADVLRTLLPPGEYRVVAGVSEGREPDHDWLRDKLGTPLVADGERFTAIVSVMPDLDELRAHGRLAVASAPVAPEEIADAARETTVLLERARAAGKPIVSGAGLDAVVPTDAAKAFAARTLAPLAGRPELVETLRCWLAHHGGWDRTAAALGVHRNSVRHRIAQAGRLLGTDLSDPEQRMQLWFALRWA
ncbi:PucR family transcriptional regulator [Amycolatopsis pigmentata]|uniref:PucR family transcriptional regulator n=1 Tax=Amycolatopsis pigmentata TaxID=450801 RepID=A0ABW5FPF6_9PSEU